MSKAPIISAMVAGLLVCYFARTPTVSAAETKPQRLPEVDTQHAFRMAETLDHENLARVEKLLPGDVAEVARNTVVAGGLLRLERARELVQAGRMGVDDMHTLDQIAEAQEGNRCRIIDWDGIFPGECKVRFETGPLEGKAFYIDQAALRKPN